MLLSPPLLLELLLAYADNSGFLLAFLLLLGFLDVAGVLLLLALLDVTHVPVFAEFLLLLAFLYVDGILLLLRLLDVAPVSTVAEFLCLLNACSVRRHKLQIGG
jgi:hypothetical protein